MRILCVPQHEHTFSASLRSTSSRRRGRSAGFRRRPCPFRFDGGGNSGGCGTTGVVTSASGESIPSNRVAFDPLAAAAERHLHEAVEVGLLGLNLLAEVGHDATEFGDDGVGVGQLPAEHLDVVGRWHAGFNTATRPR